MKSRLDQQREKGAWSVFLFVISYVLGVSLIALLIAFVAVGIPTITHLLLTLIPFYSLKLSDIYIVWGIILLILFVLALLGKRK